MAKKTGALATPGADGRWPDERVAWAFWDGMPPATVRQRARHEAGHAVVAHTLGVECASVGCDRSAARPSPGVVRQELRGAWSPTDKPYSHEEQVVIMFGGRIENERDGLYLPLVLAPAYSDEVWAISSALALAHGDAREASKILASAYAEAKRILDSHQDDVTTVADALTEGDLTASDMERILRPLPPASVERRIQRNQPVSLDKRSALQCVAAMMDGRPFALAWLCFVSPMRMMWLDMDGTLRPPIDYA
jgi:hypothetical protein